MDAKPQRPVRNMRVYGDENAIPGHGIQKTIHQRNKSSPALSTLAQAGALKAAAKRTAFGDLGNAANISKPSKDDMAIPPKGYSAFAEKPVAILPQGKKPAALLRPAQRPLSVSGLKSLLHNVSGVNAQATAKQPFEAPQPTQTAVELANTKKLAAKRSSTVFKDTTISHPDQSGLPAKENIFPSAPPPPVHHQLPSIQYGQLEQLLEEAPKPDHSPSELLESPKPATSVEDRSQVLSSSEAAAPLRSDGIYIDNYGEVRQYIFQDETEVAEDQGGLPIEKSTNLAETVEQQMPSGLDRITDMQHGHEVTEPKLVPTSEPEEYWDEEEGNYEEEGYVTARSFKSRGENTTSGATTVLFPKVNQKIKREFAAAKQLIESTRTAEEIDDETWDTSMVAEYGEEIFGYMRDLEIKMLPNAHYMDNQVEIQWSMRSVLMDWIVQVHHRFQLLPETLFLCVNYIDRFLSCKIVSLGKLQLVGATAIFVAAKYEEINCPSVQEIVYMVDGGYAIDEVLKAERFMLSMLQFELGWPGPMSFLRRISKADDYDLETRTLAKYFLEITIMDERFIGSPPSFVAAGAHCLARMMLKKGNWSPAHTYYSEYTYTQLYTLVLLMVECCEDPRKHHAAIFDKYMDKKFKRASLFAETEMRRGFQVLDIDSSGPGAWQIASEDPVHWRLKN
ncbi:B-type cyclin [Xanthoria calcicola]